MRPKEKFIYVNQSRTCKMACLDTVEQLIIDLVGEDSNIKTLFYNSHLGVWEIKFKQGTDLEFEDFQELYRWIKVDTLLS